MSNASTNERCDFFKVKQDGVIMIDSNGESRSQVLSTYLQKAMLLDKTHGLQIWGTFDF
jgi:hypothetical protein